MQHIYAAIYCIHAAFSCWDNTANMLQVYCNSVREVFNKFCLFKISKILTILLSNINDLKTAKNIF